jgi:mono/diheme cytochrome c family protein
MNKGSTIIIGALIALALALYYAFFIIPEMTKVSERLQQTQMGTNTDTATTHTEPEVSPAPSEMPSFTTESATPTPAVGATTSTEVAGEPDFELAKSVILGESCGSCHTLQAAGLNLTGDIGPDLSATGTRNRSSDWLILQLTDPTSIPDAEVAEGFEGMQTVMPSYNRLSEQELASVAAFLQSLDKSATPVVVTTPLDNSTDTETDTIALAKSIIQSNGCGSCHTLNNDDFALLGQVGPDLTTISSRGRTQEWLLRQLTDPTSISDEEVAEGYQGMQTVMPSFNRALNDIELQALVDYLLTL